MQANSAYDGEHNFSEDRFEIMDTVEQGAPVLLIDDTFTSGAHAQSAAATLCDAGAGPIAVVCLGRHFGLASESRYRGAEESYLQRARALGWSWTRCYFCTPEIRATKGRDPREKRIVSVV